MHGWLVSAWTLAGERQEVSCSCSCSWLEMDMLSWPKTGLGWDDAKEEWHKEIGKAAQE